MSRWWGCCFGPSNSKMNTVTTLDLSHSSLVEVPVDIFSYERTLEELYLNSNRIYDLPRQLFLCSSLKILNVSDNDLARLPDAITELKSLQQLDLSRNALSSLPDLGQLQQLCILNLSLNPLDKIPDLIFTVTNLTELYLNDTNITFVVANIGKLMNLTILEIRENKLNSLPESISRLKKLTRLDVGQNELTSLPLSFGQLHSLTELSLDLNDLEYLPEYLVNLKQLIHLDCSFNNISNIELTDNPNMSRNITSGNSTTESHIEGPNVNLKRDMHNSDRGEFPDPNHFMNKTNDGKALQEPLLNTICSESIVQTVYLNNNNLNYVPSLIFNMINITTLRLEGNYLTHLSSQVSRLVNLEELILTSNNLTSLPGSIGWLKFLKVLMLDDNLLECLPKEISSCIGLTILSVRNNKLTHLMPDLGHLQQLTVLNIINNRIKFLPVAILNLNHIKAIWISETQNKPLVPLQKEYNGSEIVLTCVLLPQTDGMVKNYNQLSTPDQTLSDKNVASITTPSSSRHINFSLEPASTVEDKESASQKQTHKLNRSPTPYPKQLKQMAKNLKSGNKYQQQSTEIKQAKIITPSDSTNLDKFDSFVVYEQNIDIREAKNTKSTDILDKNYPHVEDKPMVYTDRGLYDQTNASLNGQETADGSLYRDCASTNTQTNDETDSYEPLGTILYPEQLYGQRNFNMNENHTLYGHAQKNHHENEEQVYGQTNNDHADSPYRLSETKNEMTLTNSYNEVDLYGRTKYIQTDNNCLLERNGETIYNGNDPLYGLTKHKQNNSVDEMYDNEQKSGPGNNVNVQNQSHNNSEHSTVPVHLKTHLFVENNVPLHEQSLYGSTYGHRQQKQELLYDKSNGLYDKTRNNYQNINSNSGTNRHEPVYGQTKPPQPPPYDIAKNYSKNAKYFSHCETPVSSPTVISNKQFNADEHFEHNSNRRIINDTPISNITETSDCCLIPNFIENHPSDQESSFLVRPKAQKVFNASQCKTLRQDDRTNPNLKIAKSDIMLVSNSERCVEKCSSDIGLRNIHSSQSNINKSKIPLSPNMHKKFAKQNITSPKYSPSPTSPAKEKEDLLSFGILNESNNVLCSENKDDDTRKTKIPQMKKNWIFGQHKNAKVFECTIYDLNFTVEERHNESYFVSSISNSCQLQVGDKILQINEETVHQLILKTNFDGTDHNKLTTFMMETPLPFIMLISRLT